MSTIKFYDDRIVMVNETLKATGELKYNQFFAVLESKDWTTVKPTIHKGVTAEAYWCTFEMGNKYYYFYD